MAPNTFAKVATSLGDETLMLAGLTGHEALGRPFEYELDLFSLDGKISLKDIIAQPVTVQIELQEGKYRFINGLVTRFGCIGASGRHTHYRATLRPWLWLLTRHTDCRIFQNETVPDVILKVFRDAGFSDFDKNLSRSYRPWEYICQYRESSFNFVSRLMEQEGIYYYFKHEDGKHTLYMTDSYAGHQTQEGYEEVPYFPPYPGEQRERDHIDGWRVTQEIQAGRFSLNDFDFKKPKSDLQTALNAPDNKSDFEIYDYPGEYEKQSDGEAYNRVRMEQATSEYEVAEGQGNARGLVVGALFKLKDLPRDDENQEYLVTQATFSLDTGEFESTHRTGAKVTYRVSCQVLKSSTPFRPARETPKPEITGPQTAIVTGGTGDEIYTDQYGRVKVKFPWDRTPEKNEKSSCWVRVSQVWAGAKWGAMHIPRVGQEVVVEFLEGDPDRPLITGRVYNATTMPPYDLPDNKTQSGIKSRSTKGGTSQNFNELRFEDKKSEEQVYFQAEKNLDTLVKNDETHTVKANRTKSVSGNENASIGGDRSKTVTGNETNAINQTRTTTVTLADTQNYLATRTTTVTAVDTLTVNTGPRLETYNSGRTTVIQKFDNLTINKANKNTTVHGQFNITSDEHFKLQQAASQVFVKNKVFIETDGDIELKNGGTHYTGGQGGKLTLNVNNEIKITCGAASISLKKDGTIEIVGVNVRVGNASNNASFEPAGATISAAKISATAVGIHEISGALVKIG
jgi:type VI secretion system secreted protein VgrG